MHPLFVMVLGQVVAANATGGFTLSEGVKQGGFLLVAVVLYKLFDRLWLRYTKKEDREEKSHERTVTDLLERLHDSQERLAEQLAAQLGQQQDQASLLRDEFTVQLTKLQAEVSRIQEARVEEMARIVRAADALAANNELVGEALRVLSESVRLQLPPGGLASGGNPADTGGRG